MKPKAFECAFHGLESRASFSYKRELREAMSDVRSELDKTVHLYVSRFPTYNYRTLARRLYISPAKLCEILRPFPHGRRRGRRKTQVKREEVRQALEALNFCVVNGRADDAGNDAYQYLNHWLRKGKGTKTLLQRAGHSTQRYEALRSRTNSKRLD